MEVYAVVIMRSATAEEIYCTRCRGLDPEGKCTYLTYGAKQASSDEWVTAWCKLVKKWKPIGWAEEMGQIKSGVGPSSIGGPAAKGYCAREMFPTRATSLPERNRSASNRLYNLYVLLTRPGGLNAGPKCFRSRSQARRLCDALASLASSSTA